MKRIVQFIAMVAAGSITLLWAKEIAYRYRGYKAIGGEYLLAILAAIIVGWLIKYYFERS